MGLGVIELLRLMIYDGWVDMFAFRVYLKMLKNRKTRLNLRCSVRIPGQCNFLPIGLLPIPSILRTRGIFTP